MSVPASIPAVADIVDRIRKRRRAEQIIDHAAALNDRQIAVIVIHEDQRLPLAKIDADDLMEFNTTETGLHG